MKIEVRISELFENIPELFLPLFEGRIYPWEVLGDIKAYANKLTRGGAYGYTLYKEGVLIGENVKIYEGVTILPPAVIGSGTELRPGAFIRGAVLIGENSVIGNSCELKNCVLFDKVQVPHYNYVGDSVLGTHAHMGAGAITSNLKSVSGTVKVRTDDGVIDTGLRKLGAMLGDGADIGCGTVMNPGTVVGKNTSVYPLISLRGSYPAECIVKANADIVKKHS